MDDKELNHDLLTFKVEKGLAFYGKSNVKAYRERADYELGVVKQTGFSPYFLILADLTAFMRRNGIMYMVRGSGCGSLCVWACLISHSWLDPVTMDLPFERFLNPARVSNPDIDVDIDDSRRAEVVKYTVDKYGADRVARICNFGTLGAKAVINDLARALEIPDHQQVASSITAFISNKPGTDLETEIANSEVLQRFQQQMPVLFSMALKAEGLVRQPGQHAAGTVIAPDNIWNYLPTFFRHSAEGGEAAPVTQWDMYDVEERGLLKMDYLGLKTLGVIQKCVETINQIRQLNNQPPFVLDDIPKDDQATWDLIGRGELAGVFQVEKQFVRNFAKRMNLPKQRSLWALAVLISIIRPGMMDSGMTEKYLLRTEGKEAPTPPHPLLEKTLKKSYGCLVFQEDCMAACRDMAGMTMSEADTVRRGISKKQAYILEKMKPKFIEGSIKNGATKEQVEEVWGLMDKFGRYGFNNAHAAAYAVLAYQTGYLKTHFPLVYLAHLINSESGSTSKDQGYNFKVAEYIEEARRLKINIGKPCIKRSMVGCAIDIPRNEIIFGLGLIKRVSEGSANLVVNRICGARTIAEFFIGCHETRLTGRKVMRTVAGQKVPTDRDEFASYSLINSKEIEAMIEAGALDHYIDHDPSQRQRLMVMTKDMLDLGSAYHEAYAKIISGRRTMKQPEEILAMMNAYTVNFEAKTMEAVLDAEHAATGCYLSYSPFAPFANFHCGTASELFDEESEGTTVTMGLLADFRPTIVKNGKNTGKQMAHVKIGLPGGDVEGVVFSNIFEQLVKDPRLLEAGKVYNFTLAKDTNRPQTVIVNWMQRLSSYGNA